LGLGPGQVGSGLAYKGGVEGEGSSLRGVRLDAAPGAEDAAEAVLAREGGGVDVGVSRRVLRRRRLEVRASVEYTRACLCLSRAIAIVER
jgi:hypothetical protein